MSDCRRCPRLAGYRDSLALKFPDYHCRPVDGWGDRNPRLLIVGLAPGLHGANRTGKPFTGDASGDLLFRMLREFGLATGSGDALQSQGTRIVNAVRCIPPGNRPMASEIRTCNRYLIEELNQAESLVVILSLGHVAHRAVLMALKLRAASFAFAHGRIHGLDSRRYMIDSYHCSRYNIQTRRLTVSMFRSVFKNISTLIDE